MARPKLRTPELRQHVLDVAQETLARYGVEGFTTKQIAQAASTSVPAMYELFGDKTVLFANCISLDSSSWPRHFLPPQLPRILVPMS